MLGLAAAVAPIGLAANAISNANGNNQQQNQPNGDDNEPPAKEAPPGQDNEPTPNSDDNNQPQPPSDIKESNQEMEDACNFTTIYNYLHVLAWHDLFLMLSCF